MRLEQLYYLSEVAKNRSITLTSERIYVSQPNISESLKNLENELGVILFRRSRQGIEMTEIGERTVQTANQIFNLIQDLKDEAQKSKKSKPLSGNLVIYSVPSINQTILPEAISLLYERHPNLTFTTIQTGLKDIVLDIKEGKGDIGLIFTTDQIFELKDFRETLNNLHYQCLTKEKSYALVGINSPFINKKSISTRDLSNQDVVVHDVFEWSFDTLPNPNIILKTSNIQMCFKIVSESKAIGFTNNLIINHLDYIDKSKVKFIPVKDNINYSLAFITREELKSSELIQEFLTVFKSLL